MGLFTSTAFASGFSRIACSTSLTFMPRGIPSASLHWGSTYTGTAPHSTRAQRALLWTFLGRMIFSPRFTTESTMLCTAEVVPPTMRKAWAAPNASAASSSACRITDTGWHRLSRGFMEFTSRLMHCSPRSFASSGFPLPLLCPGTSKGTTLFFFSRSRASYIGAFFCVTSSMPSPPRFLYGILGRAPLILYLILFFRRF